MFILNRNIRCIRYNVLKVISRVFTTFDMLIRLRANLHIVIRQRHHLDEPICISYDECIKVRFNRLVGIHNFFSNL